MNLTLNYNQNDKSLIESFYREIFQEKEYDRFGVNINKNDVVLDLGANIGIFCKYALEMGASKVISYECDDNNYQYLTQNINDRRAELYLGYIGHNLITISDIIEKHNLDKINFIKLDIEGYEWDLLKNINPSIFEIVDKWAIEFHTWHNNPNSSGETKFNTIWQLLEIMEVFCKNGYKIYFEHIHKGWDIVMLYAKKDIITN